MTPADIPEVVRLHQAVMGSTFNAWLGPAHLQHLYTLMSAHPECVTLVAVEDGKITGAVSGTSNLSRFSADLMRRTPLRAKVKNGLRVLLCPAKIGELLESFRLQRLVGRSQEQAVLTTMMVQREMHGRGVGRLLFTAFGDALAARGVRTFRLDTLLSNSGARAFYEKMGMTRLGQTRQSILYGITR